MKEKITYNFMSVIILTLLFFSCGGNNGKFDATGTFESEEIIVSSEATGKLLQFDAEEGAELKADRKSVV